MTSLALNLVLAPTLAAVSILATRRWGPRTGGVVSAFPAIAGPVLLITALTRGRLFAAHTANGVLLGLGALSAFAAAYGRAARRSAWHASLAAGWAAAAIAATATGIAARGTGTPAGLLVAAGSLLLALRALPPATCALSPAGVRSGSWSCELVIRMALSAALVAGLSAAVAALGALAGGMLASLPVLASILVVLVHRERGGAAAVDLLRGMLTGMGGFVAFCEVLALAIGPCGTAVAFGAATLAALAAQGLAVYVPAATAGPPHYRAPVTSPGASR